MNEKRSEQLLPIYLMKFLFRSMTLWLGILSLFKFSSWEFFIGEKRWAEGKYIVVTMNNWLKVFVAFNHTIPSISYSPWSISLSRFLSFNAICFFFVTLSLCLSVLLFRNWKSNPNLAHCVQPLIHIKSISKIHRRRSAQNYNVKQIFADWINQCAYCFRLNIMYVYLSIYIYCCVNIESIHSLTRPFSFIRSHICTLNGTWNNSIKRPT